VVERAAAQLDEMPQVAPAQIRDAVTAIVDDLRAEARERPHPTTPP
jgi:hypothetical protein